MWATEGQKKRRIRGLVTAIVLLMSCVSASSRPFTSFDDPHLQGQSTKSLPPGLESKQGFKRVEVVVSEEACEGLSTLGSRPPNCEHKCGGCIPCGAIQVPTPTTNHLGLQSANYEPEGWKCKCGDSFFNP